jgi:hypothetical protein
MKATTLLVSLIIAIGGLSVSTPPTVMAQGTKGTFPVEIMPVTATIIKSIVALAAAHVIALSSLIASFGAALTTVEDFAANGELGRLRRTHLQVGTAR